MKKTWSVLLFAAALFSASHSAAVSSEEYSKAGLSLLQEGKLDLAAQYLKAAVQADVKNWEAYQYLGQCLQKQNKPMEALEAYDKSLALHPDNPLVKASAAAIRKQPGAAAPPLPDLKNPVPSAAGNLLKEGDLYAAALLEAQEKVRAGGMNPQEHPLLTNFYTGKLLEEKSRAGLRAETPGRVLGVDEKYVGKYGAPKSDFFNPHFTLDLGLLTPTFGNLDLGFFLDPTTNLGLAFCYVPLPYTYYSGYSSGYQTTTLSRELIYLEPRIKYYSAPSGLTTYHGFSFVYFGLHQPPDPTGYQSSSFDVFGLGYLFGFRTLPMSGLTMELGWKMGVATIFLNQSKYVGYSTSYTYTYVPSQTVVPFPYIIPEFRFGFTF